jgi:hypothetical protein
MLHTRRRAGRFTAVAAAAAAALIMTAGAVSAARPDSEGGKSRTATWTQSGVGASISQDDGSFLVIASVKNSVDGDGAVVSRTTLDGSAGTNTATRYQANGVQKFRETFTLGAADASGLIPYQGSGECTGPGTGVHKREKCTYTFTGTLNSTTNVVNFDINGKTTR